MFWTKDKPAESGIVFESVSHPQNGDTLVKLILPADYNVQDITDYIKTNYGHRPELKDIHIFQDIGDEGQHIDRVVVTLRRNSQLDGEGVVGRPISHGPGKLLYFLLLLFVVFAGLNLYGYWMSGVFPLTDRFIPLDTPVPIPSTQPPSEL